MAYTPERPEQAHHDAPTSERDRLRSPRPRASPRSRTLHVARKAGTRSSTPDRSCAPLEAPGVPSHHHSASRLSRTPRRARRRPSGRAPAARSRGGVAFGRGGVAFPVVVTGFGTRRVVASRSGRVTGFGTGGASWRRVSGRGDGFWDAAGVRRHVPVVVTGFGTRAAWWRRVSGRGDGFSDAAAWWSRFRSVRGDGFWDAAARRAGDARLPRSEAHSNRDAPHTGPLVLVLSSP